MVATLTSKGVPPDQPLLNTGWELSTMEPEVHGAPHYVSISKNGSEPLHLFRGAQRLWQIAPEVGAGVAYAIARSPAAHPNTVRPGEWHMPTLPDGVWKPATDFHLRVEGKNSETQPYTLQELGVDFFLRCRTTKLLWFVDPATGEVVHSGAKAAGSKGKPGKRYCPLCMQCFSANNFVSQHLKNLHTPPEPTAPIATLDGSGGAHLSWRVENCPPGARPCGFAVQFSVDNGATWETAVDDTASPEPRARVSALIGGLTYRFRTAVITIAGPGPFSLPSEGMTAPDAQTGSAALPLGAPKTPAAVVDDQLTPPLTPSSPPTSPPPESAALATLFASADNDATMDLPPVPEASNEPLDSQPLSDVNSYAGGTKRKNERDSTGSLLEWSLEELVGVCSTTPSAASSAAPTPNHKRQATGADTADLQPTPAQPTQSAPPEPPAPPTLPAPPAPGRLTSGTSATADKADDPDAFLDMLLATFKDEPQLPVYRSISRPDATATAATAAATSTTAAVETTAATSPVTAVVPASAMAAPPTATAATAVPALPEATAAAVSSNLRVVYSRARKAAGTEALSVTAQAQAAVKAEARATLEAKSQSVAEVTKLQRLRRALAKSSAASKTRMITADVLTRVASTGSSRELALLLTYAPESAATAAAASDFACSRALRTSRSPSTGAKPAPPPAFAPRTSIALPQTVPAMMPRSDSSSSSSSSSSNPGSGSRFSIVAVAIVLLAAFTAYLNPCTPLPSPSERTAACHWKVGKGCVPSNDATASCRLQLLKLFAGKQLCKAQ